MATETKKTVTISLPQDELAEFDEIEAIEQARKEFSRGETISLEDLQRELGLSTK